MVTESAPLVSLLCLPMELELWRSSDREQAPDSDVVDYQAIQSESPLLLPSFLHSCFLPLKHASDLSMHSSLYHLYTDDSHPGEINKWKSTLLPNWSANIPSQSD